MQRNVGDSIANAVQPELSLLRIYLLRVAYLIIAAGLAVYVWPNVIHHANGLAATGGVRLSMLAGLGAIAALGLRYPVKMLPVLLFELSWKAIYLGAFALPLWSSDQMTAAVQDDVNSIHSPSSCYAASDPLALRVCTQYVAKQGDRWK